MSTYRTNHKALRKRDTSVGKTKRGASHKFSGASKIQRKVMKNLGLWDVWIRGGMSPAKGSVKEFLLGGSTAKDGQPTEGAA